MQFTEDSPISDNIITGYAEDFIEIDQQPYQHSLLVFPNSPVIHLHCNQCATLHRDDLEPVLEYTPEVLLVGSGATFSFPDNAIQSHFLFHGIGVEVMDTPAACRTYNVLLSEKRKVAAALILS